MLELVSERTDNMAKLSSYRNIYSNDYDPQYKGLVDNLGIILNASFNELYTNLSNGLTIADNFAATIATVTLTVDSNGKPQNTTQFALKNGQTTVSGLTLLDAQGASDSTLLPTGGIFVSFITSGNNVVIQNVKGLQANSSYTLKLLAFA
jgi:hypothetical protein